MSLSLNCLLNPSSIIELLWEHYNVSADSTLAKNSYIKTKWLVMIPWWKHKENGKGAVILSK